MSSTNGVIKQKKQKYPFPLSFQRDVLALMARDPGFLTEMSDALDARYFEGDELSIIAKILLSHVHKYKQRPSKSSMITRLMRYFEHEDTDEDLKTSVVSIVNSLYKRDLPSDLQFVREQCADFGRLQALKLAMSDYVEVLTKHPRDYAKQMQVVPMLTKALAVGSGHRIGIQLFDSPDTPSTFRGEMCDPTHKVPSMLPTLNEARRGGMGAGELAVVLGESGKGKSMFLVNIAAHAARQGKRVIYVTTELKEYDVAVRMLACMTKRSMDQVEDEHPDFKSIAAALKDKALYTRIASIRRGSPVTLIRSLVSRIVATDGVNPEILVIDYADELSPSRVDVHGRNDGSDHGYFAYGDIYYELTNLATDYDCPIWTASQVNRAAYGQEQFGMEAASDSIKKAQVADAVLCLCQTAEEEQSGKQMHVFVDKLRRGRSKFKIPMMIDFAKCIFRERGPNHDRESKPDEKKGRAKEVS